MNNDNDRIHEHSSVFLSNTPLFRELSNEKLEELLQVFYVEKWPKGTYKSNKITNQYFYIILNGRMELLSSHPKTGKQFTLCILRPGDIYDVSSLLVSQKQALIPVAIDELQLLSAPLSDVRKWLSSNPEFYQSLSCYLAQYVRQIEQVASDLALLDISTRLARVIHRHLPVKTIDGRGNPSLIEPIAIDLLRDLSNEQLAKLIGSVRQVVNKHLRLMEKQGITQYTPNQIFIADLELLEKKGQLGKFMNG